MIFLSGLFIVFVLTGYAVMKRKQAAGKEKTVFLAISVIGYGFWVSILLNKQVDVNRVIGWVIERIF